MASFVHNESDEFSSQICCPPPLSTPLPRLQWLDEDTYQAQHVTPVAKALSHVSSLTQKTKWHSLAAERWPSSFADVGCLHLLPAGKTGVLTTFGWGRLQGASSTCCGEGRCPMAQKALHLWQLLICMGQWPLRGQCKRSAHVCGRSRGLPAMMNASCQCTPFCIGRCAP